MTQQSAFANIHNALPPRGSAVRDTQLNKYGMVVGREGRKCQVRYLDGRVRTAYASNLQVIRKVRTVY